MLRIFLVRHGETDWNAAGRMQGATDIPLNPTGIRQAQCLAARLAKEGDFAAIYTSGLQRAVRTAQIIAKRLDLPIISDARLAERNLGAIEGLTLDEVREQFPEADRIWREGGTRLALPGEEPREEFQRRLREFSKDLQTNHRAQNVIVVTHGGAMIMLLATLLKLDLERPLPFWIDNASITIVQMGERGVRLRLLNDICHLDDGHEPDQEKLAMDQLKTVES